MTVFLCPYRVPVAILESCRPVVLDSSLCSSPYGDKLDSIIGSSLLYTPHSTSPHTWLVPRAPSRSSLHQGWQCPESQAPLPRQKCPAAPWLRAGVILRWGGMHDSVVCVGVHVIGCVTPFFPFGNCFNSKTPFNFMSASSLFCCCWWSTQLQFKSTDPVLVGINGELQQFTH